MSGPPLDSDLNIRTAAAQAWLAAIIESSDDAIVSKTLDGVITSWNAGAERVFGWTSEEVVGKPILILIPHDRQQEEPEILRRLQAGERVDHFETIRKRKDGRLIDVSVTISPIRDSTGRIIGASKIARDITLQKRFQEQLEAARHAAEQARKEAEVANLAKDHFMSVLSHELRTPLTPVLMAISMMEQDRSTPPQFAEQIAMIRRNVETEARLVDDLLDVTRIVRGKMRLHLEAVDVHAIIRDIVTMFERQAADKGLTVVPALRAGRTSVWADPGRLQQVLLNLMSNAVKFTPQGGTIAIRTADENDEIKIEVIDTGLGIDPAIMPRLFQPFEQGEQPAAQEFGGLGLGLSIVKALVDLHGGSISVTSAGRDRGARFTIRLGTIDALPQKPAAVPAESEADDRRPHRVLLVEDHRDTRQVLSRLLASVGCVVTVAGGVREAIDAAESEPIDLLVSDISLPDGSGMDVMRHIAARFPSVRGIALSGYGAEEDFRRSSEAGFVVHLTKPISLNALRQAIRDVTAASAPGSEVKA